MDIKYICRVYDGNVFMGILQNLSSSPSYSQDINTSSAQMVLKANYPLKSDTLAIETIQTESGLDIETEDSRALEIERQVDIYEPGQLLDTGRNIKVYEYSSDDVDGTLIFDGIITKLGESFGANMVELTITLLSKGSDLDQYLIEDIPAIDQNQLTQDASGVLTSSSKGGFFSWVGQTYTVGAGVTSLATIKGKFSIPSGSGDVTVFVIRGWSTTFLSGSEVGEAVRTVSSSDPTDYIFTFDTPLAVNEGEVLFIQYVGEDDKNITYYYKNSDVYGSGQMYTLDYGGAGPAGPWVGATADLYFETGFTGGATSVPFTEQDPADILQTILDYYGGAGGTVQSGTGTIEATGNDATYTFKINTALEGVNKCLELAPSDWYWYVDPGTNILYFKQTNTTADHTFILGRHVEALDLQKTIEKQVNVVYFSGGLTGGSNLFIKTVDQDSINNGRRALQRISDNRVTLTDTANAIIDNTIGRYRDPAYTSTITIARNTYDINLLNIGDTIRIQGYGNFIDQLILQIVSKQRLGDSAVLGVGILPYKTSQAFIDAQRSITLLETENNPDSPD